MKLTRTLLAVAALAAFGSAFAGDAPKAPAEQKECKDKGKCCGKECKDKKAEAPKAEDKKA